MLTIGQIAKRFSLSRSTLLYYNRIGLLVPSGRSEANYRLYSASDVRKMEMITIYRQAGIPLKDIKELVSSDSQATEAVLLKRLNGLNQEISALRNQQQVIVKLLGNKKALNKTKVMNKEIWVGLLREAGLDDEAMHRWHIVFERQAPEGHQDFLESLGIGEDEIIKIRKWSSE